MVARVAMAVVVEVAGVWAEVGSTRFGGTHSVHLVSHRTHGCHPQREGMNCTLWSPPSHCIPDAHLAP